MPGLPHMSTSGQDWVWGGGAQSLLLITRGNKGAATDASLTPLAPVLPWAHHALSAPIKLGAPRGPNWDLLLWEPSPSTPPGRVGDSECLLTD